MHLNPGPCWFLNRMFQANMEYQILFSNTHSGTSGMETPVSVDPRTRANTSRAFCQANPLMSPGCFMFLEHLKFSTQDRV